MVDCYKRPLANVAEHPDAAIPVEKTVGAILLVRGESDTMWPSWSMSPAVPDRANGLGGRATVLASPTQATSSRDRLPRAR